MYTVNSFVLLNEVTTVIEQREDVSLHNVMILVRKKANETDEDEKILQNILKQWDLLVRHHRILDLKIYTYDHDPDHYYTILGDKLVFTGHVYFDNNKPTNTNVGYNPLDFCNNNNLGREVIKEFQAHFDNMLDKHKDNLLYEGQS